MEDRQLDWFRWREGEYIPLQPNSEGIVCSEVYPGLWLDPEALLSGDLSRVIAVVQDGLATPEHQ